MSFLTDYLHQIEHLHHIVQNHQRDHDHVPEGLGHEHGAQHHDPKGQGPVLELINPHP